MNYVLHHRDSHPMAEVQLQADQSVRVEPGAMVAMSSNVELSSSVPGGLAGLIQKRSDQPERRQRFQILYTARKGPGTLMLAPGHPGEIYPMALANHNLLVQSYCFLACESHLEVDEEVPNGGLFFSKDGHREDQYLVKVSGTGMLLLSSYGNAHLHSIPAGERFLVDTSHVVAFESRLGYQIREPAQEVWLRLAAAEGLVAEFEGPGEVLIQTRNLHSLAGKLKPFLKE